MPAAGRGAADPAPSFSQAAFEPAVLSDSQAPDDKDVSDPIPEEAPAVEEAAVPEEEIVENEAPEEAASPLEETRDFVYSEEDEKAATREISELSEEEIGKNKKIDAVFNHTKGTVSADTGEEEYNHTAALLQEVFGSDKKKKKKAAPDFNAEPGLAFSSEEEAIDPLSEEENDSYVAVHDGQDEKTKEYNSSFSIEETLNSLTPEEDQATVPQLSEEVRVQDQENPYLDNDHYDDFSEKDDSKEYLPDEFSAQEDYDEFAEYLRNRNFRYLCNVAWSVIAFFATLYLESALFSNLYHPEFLKPGGIYNMVYLVIDIQLVMISALLVLSSLGDGVRGLFRLKPNRNTIPFLATVLAVAHPVVLMLSHQTDYALFGSVASLFCLISSICALLESKRIYRTFRIFGKAGEKFMTEELPEDAAEKEAFREQLEGEPKFYSVKRTNFVDGFFEGVEKPSSLEKSFGVSLILSLLVAIAFGALSFRQEASWLLAFNRFTAMAMMCFPLCGVFTVVLPFSHLSRVAEKKDCAILSAAESDEHAFCDVVSFADQEIFPPKSVKVSTIRTYGQTRIDEAILYAAMIFQKLGGPLSLVFKKAIAGVCTEIPDNFDFLEITSDGMCAKIGGKDVFVGNRNYLMAYDFGYTKDTIDDSFESKAGRIMYMVIGSELAAKFYVRYAISKRFKKTLLTIFKTGVCPAVKTCDPNVDSELLSVLLQNDRIPAGIIKTCEVMKETPPAERAKSGLVCTSTISNLLRGFKICDSLRRLSKINIAIKLISLFVGAGVVLFLHLFGDLSRINGLFVLIYQLLWLIPVVIPSLTE
ncbi:MAG: hypothetical protein IKD31_02270 [Clostridia bacterium]|nr:hypothetical protein [Clostridia bacterium]